ncbi:MAG TPA: phenylalanine 4-monooxygenase [Acidimicrobiia bacterium]|nr:phenylalanine 4-monooxygenase [Acidimicrobiia bacterium]
MDDPLYAPVRRGNSGDVEVLLGSDHPGVNDAAYRARRNAIAALTVDWQRGQPVPGVEYSDVEHDVWRICAAELEPLHQRFACRAFVEAKEELGLPTDHVPQLDEVTGRLQPLTGFEYLPVAGLAPLREFYASFGDNAFFSTQYLRHHSMPLYTPEPDIVHEVIGHANQLAVPEFAAIYRLVGEAVHRTETDEALKFLSQVFWFTMEFGVVREDGERRAYGAGILSSIGETAAFHEADIRPLDFSEMGAVTYDITRYQPVLYEAASMGQLVDEVSSFFASYDDEAHSCLVREVVG